MKYTNKTIYTPEICREIGIQKSFSYEMLSTKGIIWAAIMWIAVRVVSSDNKSIYNWIFALFAVIIVPTIFFVIPAIRNKSMYKKTLQANNGEELVTTVLFEKQKIEYSNNVNQKAVRKYEDVARIKRTSKLVIIYFDKVNPIFLDINGFINCKYEEIEDFLKKKCPKAFN
ncbi:MAG: hypothetical protein GX914_04095 [Erysipelotrichia bacterium]|nr:hypothetical protein [Erysipelotrichia bacterium]